MVNKSIQLVQDSASAQASIEITTGLLEQYDNLLECVAASVYKFGLSKSARKLGIAKGNLSRQMDEEDFERHFSIEKLEALIEISGDVSIVQYLAEKYLIKRGA